MVDRIVYDLMLAIATGLVATLIFFLVLRIFRPRIKISDKIVKSVEWDAYGDVVFCYVFKFVNYTRSDVENVAIDLFIMEEYLHGSGKNYTANKLRIAQAEFKFLVGTKNKDGQIHNNCVQMTIDESLEAIWNGEKEWLQVQIDSRHSKSGRRHITVQTYRDPANTIVNGKFDSGENFRVLKQ